MMQVIHLYFANEVIRNEPYLRIDMFVDFWELLFFWHDLIHKMMSFRFGSRIVPSQQSPHALNKKEVIYDVTV